MRRKEHDSKNSKPKMKNWRNSRFFTIIHYSLGASKEKIGKKAKGPIKINDDAKREAVETPGKGKKRRDQKEVYEKSYACVKKKAFNKDQQKPFFFLSFRDVI
jgi:hypothetical protein